jgi:predicted HD superfamily hydrolase involved in NAD metabolism
LPHWFDSLTPTPEPIPAIRRFLLNAGRADTLRHVSRVAVVGRKLARRFGLSLAQSDLACVAHDMAAVVPAREIIICAEQLGAPLAAADRAIPQIAHGPVAAAVLRARLGVRDEDVLNAVRYHSTLRAGASPLEQLVFIADKIEHDPTARHVGFHPPLMEAARANASLPELCFVYLEWAVREGPGLGWNVHPHLAEAYSEIQSKLGSAIRL